MDSHCEPLGTVRADGRERLTLAWNGEWGMNAEMEKKHFHIDTYDCCLLRASGECWYGWRIVSAQVGKGWGEQDTVAHGAGEGSN